MLMVANTGAGKKHGSYESRSTLLFAFLTGCIRAGVDMWGVAYEACLDDKYAGKAIWEHCHDQGDAGAYLERQIERAQEKCAAPVEQLAQLSLIEYEQQRKQAAKTLGVRVSQLDRMVGAARERDQKEDVDSQIAEINAEYALVLAGNKAAVMKFEDADQVSPAAGRRVQAVVCQSDDPGRQGRHYARRLLAGPPAAAAISGHRVRAAGICRPARLLQSVSGVCRRAQGRATARSFWRT